MVKLKKSELKKHLIYSIRILKRSLDYPAYCYFILATSFFYYVVEMQDHHDPLAITSLDAIFSPGEDSPVISFQNKKQDLLGELMEAFASLESISPSLKGILLPSAATVPIPDADLVEYRDLLNHLRHHSGVFATPENFSRAFEYWIGQLAGMTSKRGVAYFTQRSLVSLLVEMVKPDAGMTIYDPTVGTGGMLMGCADYIREQGCSLASTRFYGREKSPDIWAICKMNLLVHRIENASIEQGDTLQQAQGLPGAFDLVLQNMPLSPDSGNRTQTRRMNAAFLEHALESLSPSGKAAILAPSNIVQQDYQDIWRYVVSHDWLEAVISLPPSVLYGTNASAYVLVFNKKKSAGHQSRVLFIQFPFNFPRHTAHNELHDEDLQPVLHAFEQWGNGVDYARVIANDQIAEQNYSLRLEQYPEWAEPASSFDLNAALSHYRTALQKREVAVEHLMKSLEDLQVSSRKF
jgi:type I restriction enzyme M protein